LSDKEVCRFIIENENPQDIANIALSFANMGIEDTMYFPVLYNKFRRSTPRSLRSREMIAQKDNTFLELDASSAAQEHMHDDANSNSESKRTVFDAIRNKLKEWGFI